MNKTAYIITVVTMPSCASWTYRFQRGRAVASFMRRLYRFSKRNFSLSESSEKSGGHTFFGLYRLSTYAYPSGAADADAGVDVGVRGTLAALRSLGAMGRLLIEPARRATVRNMGTAILLIHLRRA